MSPPKRFGTIARRLQAEFRQAIPGARVPDDDKGRRHGHLLAHGQERLNLYPAIRPDDRAMRFFAERGIKWWTNGRSGDRQTDASYAGPTRNLASSQVCCVNYLLPFVDTREVLLAFLQAIEPTVAAIEDVPDQEGCRSPVEFEWTGWDESLEGTPISRGANQTSIDAFMIGRDTDGRRVAWLLEWKYCEEYLGPDYKGKGKSGDTRRARYRHLYEAAGSPFTGETPFDEWLYEPFYQVMRMLLLGRRLEERGLPPGEAIDRAEVVVICPEANRDYRVAVPDLAIAQRVGGGATVEEVVRRNLAEPARFRVVGQETITARLRERCSSDLVGEWLEYHRRRYGW